jgi:hypothetical protein
MKTTSTLKAVLTAAVTAGLVMAAPDARADTQDKGFFSKLKGDSSSEVTKKDKDLQSGQRNMSNRNSKTMANRDDNKSFGESLKFWERDNNNTSASRSNANREPQRRNVMKRNQKAESKDKPSIMDRLMFWR